MSHDNFVGTKWVDLSELRSLFKQIASQDQSYYFLQWVEKLEGFYQFDSETFDLSPQGKLFNSQGELRWRQQGKGFELLLLSCLGNMGNFQPLKADWEWQCEIRDALIFPTDETRFLQSQGIKRDLKLKQRYFIHSQTSTIHFIALTV